MRRTASAILGAGLLLVLALPGRSADDFKLEAGFTLLFNGKNLDGWKEASGKKDVLDGKTDAFNGRFKVTEGRLVVDPAVKGDSYIETAKEFGKDGKGLTKGIKPGEWNKLEIAVKGGSADFVVNGEKAATQKTKGDKGPLTLRAEFGPIVIKNLRASEVK